MSDKKSFDTFIFDLDGTILDTLPDLVVVTNEALREQGFPERTHDEVLSFVGNGPSRSCTKRCPRTPRKT